MWPNLHFPADLVIFTGGILNGKLYFLCSVNLQWWHHQYLSKKSELNSFHLPILLSTETYSELSRTPTMDFFGFRRCSQKFGKIHRKTTVSETLAQLFFAHFAKFLHLICNAKFEFSWFHNTKLVIRDFNF